MNHIIIKPVGYVQNKRTIPEDDNWGRITSTIELLEEFPDEAISGIDSFSHLEIIYFFDRSSKTVTGSEHPRGNKNWPRVGIFAQRKKDRPNHIGTCIVELIKKENRKILVKNLDAIDGTPVIDIKPVFKEFLPPGELKQPEWSHDIMKNYW